MSQIPSCRPFLENIGATVTHTGSLQTWTPYLWTTQGDNEVKSLGHFDDFTQRDETEEGGRQRQRVTIFRTREGIEKDNSAVVGTEDWNKFAGITGDP